jgi:hypothetical protein
MVVRRGDDQFRSSAGRLAISGSLGDTARTQTAGANPDVRANPIDLGVDALEVGALNALGLPVRVADLVLDDALLTADCTLGWHGCSEGAYL